MQQSALSVGKHPLKDQETFPPVMNPQKVRVVFSKPAHLAKVKIGPPGANHGPFTAKPSNCHVHSTMRVTPPTSPVPPFLLMQNTHLFCAVRSMALSQVY